MLSLFILSANTSWRTVLRLLHGRYIGDTDERSWLLGAILPVRLTSSGNKWVFMLGRGAAQRQQSISQGIWVRRHSGSRCMSQRTKRNEELAPSILHSHGDERSESKQTSSSTPAMSGSNRKPESFRPEASRTFRIHERLRKRCSEVLLNWWIQES